MSTKTDICTFSGLKIYPGRGIRYVPTVNMQSTKPVFSFLGRKSRSLFHQRVNARKVAWTKIFRAVHKGSIGDVKKKRTRRVARVRRDIVGAPLALIKERRTLRSRKEVRSQVQKRVQKEKKDKKEYKSRAGGPGSSIQGRFVRNSRNVNRPAGASSTGR